MSEKKGPFDAAINCLAVMADRDFANGAPHRGVFRAAIAWLEAGGKVDRYRALLFIDIIGGDDKAQWIINVQEEIRALLAALPEDGGKE